MYGFQELQREYNKYCKESSQMTKSEFDEKFKEFNERYELKKLKDLDENELGKRLFEDSKNGNPGLFRWLEYNKKPTNCPVPSGTGFSGSIGIEYSEKESKYKLCNPLDKTLSFSKGDAIENAKTVLKALSQSCDIIDKNKSKLDSKDGYREVYKEICNALTHLKRPQTSYWYWKESGEPCMFFLKYFLCSFPQYFAPTYASTKLKGVLEEIIDKDEIDEVPFVRNGQISLYSRKLGADCLSFDRFINAKGFYNVDNSKAKKSKGGSTMVNDGNTKKANTPSKKTIDKNTILYGPPGTGKTYHTAIYAVAICDSDKTTLGELKTEAQTKEGYDRIYKRYQELIKEKRVVFTTFHQSYGYEDFIEGIKPQIDENEGRKDVYYDVEDGIFKKFCNRRLDDAWNRLVEDTEKNNNRMTFKWFVDETDRTLEYTKKTKEFYAFYDSFIQDLDSRNHYANKEGILQWLKNIENGEKEDNGFDNKRKVNLCKSVYNKLISDYNLPNDSSLPSWNKLSVDYSNKVFIIDEINRGNISKIFGELITLIEDDKRGKASVTLPYSGEMFTVPENVYIIGTMNTADRSIALMDTALRRRFTFVEMMPEPSVFDKKDSDGSIIGEVEVDGVSIKKLLTKINERIEYLYDREHTVGHAYFKEFINGEGDIHTLREIFKNKIIPLLQEYFYDDYEKISLILGDDKSDKKSATNFVITKNVPVGLEGIEGENFYLNQEIWDEKKIDDKAFADRLNKICN